MAGSLALRVRSLLFRVGLVCSVSSVFQRLLSLGTGRRTLNATIR